MSIMSMDNLKMYVAVGLKCSIFLKFLQLLFEVTAASMNVLFVYFLGHLSDPVQIPGLAHFCEHMVFLGSEKVSSLM